MNFCGCLVWMHISVVGIDGIVRMIFVDNGYIESNSIE